MATIRRDGWDKRCPKCMVHHLNCFCNKIQRLDLATKVSILIFKKEVFLPSNTAHLTIKSLSNSQDYQRGHRGQTLSPEFIDSKNYQPLYLFPTDDAVELTSKYLSSFDKPINLIVPDGTWRQAKKVHRREPLLSGIPHVKITPNQKSIYPLRRQKFEFGLCTHEAISYALEFLEDGKIKTTMMNNLKIFIEAHLTNRPIYEKEKS